MADDKIIIKREELYERIWQTPASVLAKEYRMSDSMLARVCKKLRVPKPPVGYWVKIKHSKKVPRPLLQPLGPEEPAQYEHFEWLDMEPLQVANPEFAILLSHVPPTLHVPEDLRNPDPLITNTQHYYDSRKRGLDNARDIEHLKLNVYPKSEGRALRLLDSIIKFFRNLGCEVRGVSTSNDKQHIQILGELIVFGIEERTKRIDHVLTKEELACKQAGRYFHADKWDFIPTGEITLLIDVWAPGIVRRRWSDSSRRSLEDKASEFVIGAIYAANALRKRRDDQEEAERLAAEQRRLKLEYEKKLAEEEARRKTADVRVANWIKSRQLRAFIRELERCLTNGPYSDQARQECQSWIKWANEYADQLDPIFVMLAKLAVSSQIDK